MFFFSVGRSLHAIRRFSTSPYSLCDKKTKIASSDVKYEDFERFRETPNGDVTLIDVRDPEELQTDGFIPDTVHVPIKELRDAFTDLNSDEFHTKYKSFKPSFDDPIVCFCKLGIRASKASEILRSLGYNNLGVYKGGVPEWEEKKRGK